MKKILFLLLVTSGNAFAQNDGHELAQKISYIGMAIGVYLIYYFLFRKKK